MTIFFQLIEVNGRVVSAIQHELREMYGKVETRWNDSIAQWESIPDRHLVLQEQYEEAKAKIDISFEVSLFLLVNSLSQQFYDYIVNLSFRLFVIYV